MPTAGGALKMVADERWEEIQALKEQIDTLAAEKEELKRANEFNIFSANSAVEAMMALKADNERLEGLIRALVQVRHNGVGGQDYPAFINPPGWLRRYGNEVLEIVKGEGGGSDAD